MRFANDSFQIFKSIPDSQSQAIVEGDRALESSFLLPDVGTDEAQKSVKELWQHPKKTKKPVTNDHGTTQRGYLVQLRKGNYLSLFELLEAKDATFEPTCSCLRHGAQVYTFQIHLISVVLFIIEVKTREEAACLSCPFAISQAWANPPPPMATLFFRRSLLLFLHCKQGRREKNHRNLLFFIYVIVHQLRAMLSDWDAAST